jgi:histidinol-phosphate aminotransferase
MAPSRIIAGLLKVKDSYNVDAVAVALATAAIKDQRYFKQNVEKTKAERGRLTRQLRDLGFTVPRSAANFVLAQSNNRKASEVYEQLARQSIYVRYFDLPGLGDKLRITVATAEQDDRLISALKETKPTSLAR